MRTLAAPVLTSLLEQLGRVRVSRNPCWLDHLCRTQNSFTLLELARCSKNMSVPAKIEVPTRLKRAEDIAHNGTRTMYGPFTADVHDNSDT
jgi:hypothetical protein